MRDERRRKAAAETDLTSFLAESALAGLLGGGAGRRCVCFVLCVMFLC